MMGSVTGENVDLLAEALGARLRDILLAQSRWDGFVHDPEGRRLQPLPPPDEQGRVASEMVLRAVRVAADPINCTILRRLVRDRRVAVRSLMEQTGLSRIALMEAVNDLSQVGLASYDIEAREVGATNGAAGLIGLLDEVSGRLARILGERWGDTRP